MPYEEYFKAATEGLIIADRNGRIVEANPAAERLFGYMESELIGQPIELLLPGSFASSIESMLRVILRRLAPVKWVAV